MAQARQSSPGTIPRPPVSQVVLAQVVALLVPCLVLAALKGVGPAALLVGGVIEISGRAYFGFYAFRYAGARQVAQVVRSFRRGELGKFVMVMVMLGLAFSAHAVLDPALVLVGFVWSWFVGAVCTAKLMSAGRLW